MSTTLSDVDRTANELGRHMEVEVAAPMTFVALLEAFVDAKARAVFREEMEKAEAERRQRFEELKRTLGVPVYDEGGGGPEGREEIAQLSRAPVGEDGRIRALLGDPRDSVSVGPEGAVYQRHDAPGEGYGTINVDQQGNVTEAWVGSKPTPPAKDTGDGADSLDNVPGYILSEAGMIIKEQRATIADREARLAAATTARVEANNQWRLDYNAVADAVCRAERERDEARSSLVQTEGALREQVEGRAHWNKRAIAAESSLETAERRIGKALSHLRKIKLDKPDGHLLEAIAILTPDAGTARSEDEEG